LALAVVCALREHRVPTTEEEVANFETDVLAGFVLARASAGLVDRTIRNDTNHLELIRDWFGRPLWEMQPTDADSSDAPEECTKRVISQLRDGEG
jgi:integrase/recombinase XerD